MIAAVPSQAPAADSFAPALLLVGAGEELREALVSSLEQRGLYVESCGCAELVSTAMVAAPDILVLAGLAAADAGQLALGQLGATELTSTIPVVLLTDSSELELRMSAFRYGAAAVVERKASLHVLADELAALARSATQRTSPTLGQLGESSLRDFVDALSRELSREVLRARGVSNAADLRLVLGGGRPLTQLLDDFVKNVQEHVVGAAPRPDSDTSELEPGWMSLEDLSLPAASPSMLASQPIALLDALPSRADLIAQALRAHGAQVMVSEPNPDERQFVRLQRFSPRVIVVDVDDLHGVAYPLLRRISRDPRLRWAAFLVLCWEELVPADGELPRLELVTGRIAELTLADEKLRERLLRGAEPFEFRLEILGPIPLLRVLVGVPGTHRLTVRHARLVIQIDVAEGLLAGATAERVDDGMVFSGPAALSGFLLLGAGRVRIECVSQAATMNLMSPLDAAIALAEQEPPPIAPSLPPGLPSLQPSTNSVWPTGPSPRSLVPPDLGFSLRPQREAARNLEAASERQPTASLIPMTESRQQEPLLPRLASLPEPAHFAVDEAPTQQTQALSLDSWPAPVPQATPLETADTVFPTERISGLPMPSGSSLHSEPDPPTLGSLLIASTALPPSDAESLPSLIRAAVKSHAELEVPLAVRHISSARLVSPSQTEVETPPAMRPPSGAKLGSASELVNPTANPARRLPRSVVWVLKAVGGASAIALLGAMGLVLGVQMRRVIPPANSAVGLGSAHPSPVDSGHELSMAQSEHSGMPQGALNNPKSPNCVEALSAATTPFSIYPGAAFEQIQKGRRAMQQGDLEAAKMAYCRAVQVEPKNATAHSEYARLLLSQRDGEAALVEARLALEYEPDSRVMQGYLGDALARLGQREAAANAFRREGSLKPGDRRGELGYVETQAQSAKKASTTRAWVEAERLYLRVIVMSPRDPRGPAGLAAALQRLGEPARAMSWAHYAMSLGDLDSHDLVLVQRVLSETGTD